MSAVVCPTGVKATDQIGSFIPPLRRLPATPSLKLYHCKVTDPQAAVTDTAWAWADATINPNSTAVRTRILRIIARHSFAFVRPRPRRSAPSGLDRADFSLS